MYDALKETNAHRVIQNVMTDEDKKRAAAAWEKFMQTILEDDESGEKG